MLEIESKIKMFDSPSRSTLIQIGTEGLYIMWYGWYEQRYEAISSGITTLLVYVCVYVRMFNYRVQQDDSLEKMQVYVPSIHIIILPRFTFSPINRMLQTLQSFYDNRNSYGQNLCVCFMCASNQVY